MIQAGIAISFSPFVAVVAVVAVVALVAFVSDDDFVKNHPDIDTCTEGRLCTLTFSCGQHHSHRGPIMHIDY